MTACTETRRPAGRTQQRAQFYSQNSWPILVHPSIHPSIRFSSFPVHVLGWISTAIVQCIDFQFVSVRWIRHMWLCGAAATLICLRFPRSYKPLYVIGPLPLELTASFLALRLMLLDKGTRQLLHLYSITEIYLCFVSVNKLSSITLAINCSFHENQNFFTII